MGELLTGQLNLYSETWKNDHVEVMENYEWADRINDAAAFGVFLFDQMFERLQRDGASEAKDVAPAFEAFDSWYSASSSAMSEIEAIQIKGYGSELSDQVIQSLLERQSIAAAILEDLHDAVTAIEAVSKGTSVSLEDYINELRTPLHG